MALFKEEDLPILKSRIENLNLSIRIVNILHGQNIETIWDVVKRAKFSLVSIPNFGRRGEMDMKYALERSGLDLNALVGFPHDLSGVDITDSKTLEELGIINPVYQTDPLFDVIKDMLPEALQNNPLSKEFIQAALQTPGAREKIKCVVADVVVGYLGLDKVS